jgi:hypothetical protein
MGQYTEVLKSTHFGEKNTSWLIQSRHGEDFDTWNSRVQFLSFHFQDSTLQGIYDGLDGDIDAIDCLMDKYMMKYKTTISGIVSVFPSMGEYVTKYQTAISLKVSARAPGKQQECLDSINNKITWLFFLPDIATPVKSVYT